MLLQSGESWSAAVVSNIPPESSQSVSTMDVPNTSSNSIVTHDQQPQQPLQDDQPGQSRPHRSDSMDRSGN